MTKVPVVFVDVDTQRDFLEAGGALFIQGSETILGNLARLTWHARERRIPIIATACDHAADDDEFQVFRPHCVRGTRGRQRIEQTAVADHVELAVNQPFQGERQLHLTLCKSHYDVFHREDTAHIFDTYDLDRTTVFVVYGVATDYCVRAVVKGLRSRDHHVEVVVDAIRPVDPAAEVEVLGEFVRWGVVLTMTDRACIDYSSHAISLQSQL